MDNMVRFVSWFLENLPVFLLSEPIIYFVGLGILGFVVSLVYKWIFKSSNF